MATTERDDPMAIYGQEKFKTLSRAEEVELFRKVQAGDKAARDLFIRSNIGLFISTARKYAMNNQILGDLIQEGALGMIEEAMKKFNPNQGIKFSTYATHWIKAYVVNYNRVGQHPVKYSPADGIGHNLQFISTDAPANPKHGSKTFGENMTAGTISPEGVAEENEMKKHVREAIATLPDERERAIAEGNLMGDRTLREIGEDFGVSSQAIGVSKKRVMGKLARILKKKGVDD